MASRSDGVTRLYEAPQAPEPERLPQPTKTKDKVLLDERGLLDLPFLALTVLLVLIGVVMVFSASYARAYYLTGNSTYYFARQAIFAVVGIGGMLFVSRLNYQLWRSASFIILALVWLDSRQLPLFIAALMALPVVYRNVLEGIRGTSRELLEMARVFRVPFSRRLRGVDLPQVLPYFRAAADTALGLSWKAGTAAEVIGLCSSTIGEQLYTAKVYFQTADLFAWTAVIVLLSVLFEGLFLRGVDALTERWCA